VVSTPCVARLGGQPTSFRHADTFATAGSAISLSKLYLAKRDRIELRSERHRTRISQIKAQIEETTSDYDHIAGLDEGFGAGAACGHVLVAQVPESIDIELVVREDHKVLEVLRVSAGVVEKPVQRIVDARGTE
jgi:hypothetical protein